MSSPYWTIKKKFIYGARYFFFAQILTKILSIAGHVLLARLLLPSDFGIYGVAAFIVGFLSSLFSFGLPAGLLQKKEELERHDIDNLFTIQTVVAVVCYLGIFFAAPTIAKFYGSHTISPLYIRLFSLALLFGAFKSYSVVLLERDLSFKTIAMTDLIEIGSFQITSIILAYCNYGAWAFLWGVLLSRVFGLLYSVSTVRKIPTLAFQWAPLKNIFIFGLYIQGGAVFGLLREALIPIFIAKKLGLSAMGYINWAWVLCSYPFFAVNFLDRTSFATLSRVQHDTIAFSRIVKKIVRLNNILVLGLLCLVVSHVSQIIHFVFTDKWLPAIPLVYAFSINIAFFASGNIVASALNALGRSRFTFFQSLFWFFYFWVAGVTFVEKFGMIGYGYTVALNTINYLFLYAYFWKVTKINLTDLLIGPIAAAGIAILFAFWIQNSLLENTWLTFGLSIFMTGAVYSGVIWGLYASDLKFAYAEISESLLK